MKELYSALFAAIKELDSVPKDAHGQFGGYTSLEQVISYTKPVLAKHGLFIIQTFSNKCLDTRLIYPDLDQTLLSSYALTPEKETPQSYGAAITYARRYAILALLGIASSEDPDAAQQGHGVGRNMSSAPRTTVKASTASSMGASVTDAHNFLITWGKYKDKRLGQLSTVEVWDYVRYLEKKAREENKPAGKNVELLKEALNSLETDFAEAPPIGAYKDDEIPF